MQVPSTSICRVWVWVWIILLWCLASAWNICGRNCGTPVNKWIKVGHISHALPAEPEWDSWFLLSSASSMWMYWPHLITRSTACMGGSLSHLFDLCCLALDSTNRHEQTIWRAWLLKVLKFEAFSCKQTCYLVGLAVKCRTVVKRIIAHHIQLQALVNAQLHAWGQSIQRS